MVIFVAGNKVADCSAPWDWTPGEENTRKYNGTRKGGQYDTAEKIYSGVQDTNSARSDQWSAESSRTVSAASTQSTDAFAVEGRISGTSTPPV